MTLTTVATADPGEVPVRDRNAFETLRTAADTGQFAFVSHYPDQGASGYTIFTDAGVWLFGRRITDYERSEFCAEASDVKPTDRASARALAARDQEIMDRIEAGNPLMALGLKPRTVLVMGYGSQYPPEWR